MHRIARWPAQAAAPSRAVALFVALMTLAVPPTASAQGGGLKSLALSARADWLQANEALSRSTLPSNALAIAYEGRIFGFTAGFLRIARNLSTIEGGTVGAEAAYRLGRFRMALGVTGMVGVAMASRDTTGFEYVSAGGATGHTAKWDYTRASASGGGATVSLEYAFPDYLGLRVTGGTWSFSGTPLGTERTRTTIGAGVTVPFSIPVLVSRRIP
jgi:hypothetical protein